MIYAELVTDKIKDRGVFTSLSEFLPYRVKGCTSTPEINKAADDRLVELASKSDSVIKYLAPMNKFGEDYRFEQIRRINKDRAFVPETGQTYCYNTFWGCETAEWADDYRDKERFILGHCFPTAVAALAADTAYRAKLDAQYAIARWLAEHQDWLATEEERDRSCILKFYAQYHRTPKTIVVSNWRQLEPLSVTSFRKREYADQFIADCGDHLRVVHGLPKEEGK